MGFIYIILVTPFVKPELSVECRPAVYFEDPATILTERVRYFFSFLYIEPLIIYF